MARPTKLTAAVRDRLVAAIRAGNYAEAACLSAGISTSTYYRWLERGQLEPAGIYRELCEAVRQAEGEAEVFAVALIRRAMNDGDWRAAITFLERRYPSRWRRRTSTELTGKDGGPIETTHSTKLDLSGLSDEQLELLEQINRDATDSDAS
jgi:hypothetical protein